MTASDAPRGVLVPFGRDLKRDFASAMGDDLLRVKVMQVLLTEGQTPTSSGELLWRTAFGSGLHLLRHQRNDEVLAALAQVYVRNALQKWVPEVRLIDVAAERDADALRLTIRYAPSSTAAADMVTVTIAS